MGNIDKIEVSEVGGSLTLNKVAVEFVRYVLKQNPDAADFTAIYDAMSRTACARSFHNLGYEELEMAGISFSLHGTSKLEHLIVEVQESTVSEWDNGADSSIYSLIFRFMILWFYDFIKS